MAASKFEPQGVIPACLLPFHPDLSHRREVVPQASARRRGCPRPVGDHRQRARDRSRLVHVRGAAARARDHDGRGRRPDPRRARRLCRRQPRGGAHRAHGGARRRRPACSVFPPNPLGLGSRSRPEMAIAHFKAIADASDLPLICFQYPLAGGLGYPVETLLRSLDAVPAVRAIKDWCNNPVQHERQIRLLQSRAAAGQRAHHAQLVASHLARARLQGPAVGLGQRDRGSAGGALPGGAGERSRARAAVERPDLSASRRRSTPIRSSTCTTA